MITKEQIEAVKAKAPKLWEEKKSRGLSDEAAASVILQQLITDEADPPEARAKRRLSAAQDVLKTHLARCEAVRAEYEKLCDELRAELPDLKIEDLTVGDVDPNVIKLEERIKELESEVDAKAKILGLRDERIAQLEGEKPTPDAKPAAKAKAK